MNQARDAKLLGDPLLPRVRRAGPDRETMRFVYRAAACWLGAREARMIRTASGRPQLALASGIRFARGTADVQRLVPAGKQAIERAFSAVHGGAR